MRPPFWCLESSESLRRLAEWEEGRVELESIGCPLNELHRHSGKRLSDLSIVLPGRTVEDFVWTWYSECVLQDGTLNWLRGCGFTGYQVKPVTARFKKSVARPPRLWEMVLTGWAGMADAASGIRLDESNSGAACGHLRYSGLLTADQLIDESQWDGSDFFMVWPMPRYIFVTDRVAQAIHEHRLTGVRTMRVEHLKATNGFSPGRLSYWRPEERARSIGEPLGIY